MEKSRLISIILVTFNAEEYLQRCLDSIFSQAFPHIEIIVMDGKSTDRTVQILQQNAKKLAFWKSEKDAGIYDAMNKALEHIQGSWVYFIGADDVLTPEFSKFAEHLANPNLIYYGNVIKSGKKYLGQLSPYQQAKTGINHQAIIYPAYFFKNRRYDTRYAISADHVLNMGCNNLQDYAFRFLDFDIAVFNDTGISSTQKDLIFEKEKGRLILQHFGLAIYLRFVFKKMKERISGR
ncbi:glycosyltransferase [Dyadobacter luticola]|uniref:Glycosyltransferase n=1 Tax=Dyadobacter luticola TaxID=1979387 RepID=A0A5R9L0N2_9BACT|nr:glycosyltransferase [Dyadobacter luticola]TLV02092.1 glycosyltransferase [Dyadobacter luticola]